MKNSRYICEVCSNVYDPAEGAPEIGIPPGTSFEKLPENWLCPSCGALKQDFREEDL
eukprot:gene8262-10152_t